MSTRMRTPRCRSSANCLIIGVAGHEVRRDDQHVAAAPAASACSRPSTTVSPASTSSSPGPILPGLSTSSSGRRPGQGHRAQVQRRALGLRRPRSAVTLGSTVLARRDGQRCAAALAPAPACAPVRGCGVRLAQRVQVLAVEQGLHRVGQLVVPVAVEAGRHVAHDAAGGQHVEVDEVAACRRRRSRRRRGCGRR